MLASLLSPFLGSLCLRFCSETVSIFLFGLGQFVLGLFFVVGSPVKQVKMLSVFVFRVFGGVRSVLVLPPQTGSETCTERTHGGSG